jgi:hypothetical protein
LRELFIVALIREVLGPRGGIRETLHASPLDEYVTGVLAPSADSIQPSDIDAESGTLEGEGGATAEDEAPEPDIAPPPLLAPVLNPQKRAHSIGLSFVVEVEDGNPAFDLCITWARYLDQNGVWSRQPRSALLENLRYDSVLWLDSQGNESTHAQAELSIHLLVRPKGNGRFLVRTYLVNRIQTPAGGHPAAEHHIFQPQIRLCAKKGTRIIPGLEDQAVTEEERELQFLYREKPVLARGHLCSAVWKRIDPERSCTSAVSADFSECAGEPPFRWLDGELFQSDVRTRFSPPDARTEFVPIYSVEAPELNWFEQWGVPPETDAERLSEMWNSGQLQNSLQPLVDGYRRWIDSLRLLSQGYGERDREVAARLVAVCEQVARRMQRGIDRVSTDQDAKLAFCFAMKAMSLQATWPAREDPRPLVWYPFQLAFILMSLESAIDPTSQDREICDLLWVPTGAGKTEAYLALAAYVLAFRRRRAIARSGVDRTGAGVGVISRYTLRLLSIQQFRRALKMVTACEYLRVYGFGQTTCIGWRPASCTITNNFLWGSSRFSIGLWVGGGVTPNRLLDTWAGQNIPGAISILEGQQNQGEPAQVLRCPACDGILSVPQREDRGLPRGEHYSLHLVVRGPVSTAALENIPHTDSLTVDAATYSPLAQLGFGTLTLRFSSPNDIAAEDVERLWRRISGLLPGVMLACARASRPGYFIRWYAGQHNQTMKFDFEVYCPNPECLLHRPWCEATPLGWISHSRPHAVSPAGGVHGIPTLTDGTRLANVNEPFMANSPYISDRIPVPALTVDEQVYHRCPSMVIATVDKFARPPFEPRASALFGNVANYHCIWGYYREEALPKNVQNTNGHPGPVGTRQVRHYQAIAPLDPPDLILQDELHLIEGPLGSLVGLYETAVDGLCRDARGHRVKYIASTATAKHAREQVQSVFSREVLTFPPPGLTYDDQFFLRFPDCHPFHDQRPGRLYVGICAPGRGPLTPIVRIWSRMLDVAMQYRHLPRIDPYWTLTGYFNAIRELAGAKALYRQDIPERLRRISSGTHRPLSEDLCQELSGRIHATELPMILDLLNQPMGQDALFTTSMFGTGVDVPRIGLMIVHGQPKTTSSYIQATGRVGRRQGALVSVFLRASRPRDLNHYEFFCGYHQQLQRFVEPVTVMPFAPGSLSRGLGPVGVFLLRNKRGSRVPWHSDDSAVQMARVRTTDPDVTVVPDEL